MNDLTKLAMDAHGGLERWRQLNSVSAHLLQGGVLWGLKRPDVDIREVRLRLELKKEWASHHPFTAPNLRTSMEPDRVAIETTEGKVVKELLRPRDSFKGHTLETPWDDLQLAYFAGYAMWTYLNTPFLFAIPGVETVEIQPWQEDGATWRRLQAKFPESIATHSAVQTFYFDQAGLLKRHDYEVEITGGSPAAHYVSELKRFSGILVPTKHRIFIRQTDGKAMPEPDVVSIDIGEVEFN
jgi:hypothetical protein